jgi:hypothetical protein
MIIAETPLRKWNGLAPTNHEVPSLCRTYTLDRIRSPHPPGRRLQHRLLHPPGLPRRPRQRPHLPGRRQLPARHATGPIPPLRLPRERLRHSRPNHLTRLLHQRQLRGIRLPRLSLPFQWKRPTRQFRQQPQRCHLLLHRLHA